MKANEARKASRQGREDLLDKAICVTLSVIKAACESGANEVQINEFRDARPGYYKELIDKVANHLKSLGYMVENLPEYRIRVSWPESTQVTP